MRAVNLLPSEALAAAESRQLSKYLPFIGAGLVPVVALNLVFMGYTRAHDAATAQTGQLTALRAQVAQLAPAVVVASPDTSVLVTARTQRRAALDDVLTKEIAWDATLGQVARVLPAHVWLTDLSLTAPVAADAVAPPPPAPTADSTSGTSTTAAAPTPAPAPVSTTSFTITGYAYGSDDVAALLERLQLLPTLTNVTLGQTTQTTVGPKDVVQFTVSASLAPVHVKGDS